MALQEILENYENWVNISCESLGASFLWIMIISDHEKGFG